MHIEKLGSNVWERQVIFINYLKKNKKALDRYNKFKADLAEKYKDNRRGYVDAKIKFIDDMITGAKSFSVTTKLQAIKIVKDFLKTELERDDWFIKIKSFVKAFILYGSVAKETNRSDSDIDIMIILPLEQEEKYTKGEYFYDYKSFKINIVLRSIEKLRKIAEEKKDLFQKEIFRKAEVLIDTDGEVSDLLKEISKIKDV